MFARLLGVAAAVILVTGCHRKGTGPEPVFKMGEAVRVGNLSYVATETQWLDQLGEGAAAVSPRNRFLTIRLSVTNSGIRRSVVPATELLDGSGRAYPEVPDAPGLKDWFGAFRAVQPAGTEHGVVVFDVPAGAYRLRVMDDSDAEEQKSAVILIPYQTPPAIPKPQSPIPGA